MVRILATCSLEGIQFYNFICMASVVLKRLNEMLTPFTLIFYRTSCMKGSWEKLEGTFSLSTMPDRVIFYLEGPAPGVDLLIQSVEITCFSPNDNEYHVIMDL